MLREETNRMHTTYTLIAFLVFFIIAVIAITIADGTDLIDTLLTRPQ